MNCVSQQRLKVAHITTRTKISDRKSMTKFIWTSIFYAGFLYKADDQIPEAVWVKWMTATVQEFVCLGINSIFSIYQVTPDHVACAFANENSSSFFYLSLPVITILDCQLSGLNTHFDDFQIALLRHSKIIL